MVTGNVNLDAVSPGFFSTLGIRILAGRDFDARDSRPPGEARHCSAIVNEACVKRYLGRHDSLGIHIARAPVPTSSPYRNRRGLCQFHLPRPPRTIPSRPSSPCSKAKTPARPSTSRFAAPLSGQFPPSADQVNHSLTTERLLATLSGSFGALALLLSLIGLYGVMSFVVTRRTGPRRRRAGCGVRPRLAGFDVNPTDALRLD